MSQLEESVWHDRASWVGLGLSVLHQAYSGRLAVLDHALGWAVFHLSVASLGVMVAAGAAALHVAVRYLERRHGPLLESSSLSSSVVVCIPAPPPLVVELLEDVSEESRNTRLSA